MLLLSVLVAFGFLSGVGVPLFSIHSKVLWTPREQGRGIGLLLVIFFIATLIAGSHSFGWVVVAWFIGAFIGELLFVPQDSRFFR